MFWKIFGGIVLFFMAVVLAVGLLATVSLAAVGVAVGSAIDNLDVNTVQVTDVNGHTETYGVSDLVSETGRVEITGDNGEQVTIDLNLPQITVQEDGHEVSRVVIGGESGIEIAGDGSQIRIDGRDYDNFDGGIIGRIIGGFFKGLFTLAFWTMVVVGVVLVLRSRRPAATEKTPDTVA
jgi:hypothetical protein